ncbi:MAG: UDP-3-O-(3-hydroxymyristoyl)glucosamine N-acyltransferase [Muribaculaceae bacterium]|nr:UDP-3-O-(3-hydroxymyristoyl)glucosamine N-acyltransferase [Muribaculaceae bacterium]
MEITVGTIAGMTGGEVEGDASAIIRGFGKIEEAGEGDITFIANPKYSHFIHSTNATAVLVGKDFDAEAAMADPSLPERTAPGRPVLLRVGDPYATLARLLALVQAQEQAPCGIEQPSYVSEGVEVPDDCYIGAFAYVGKGAVIGRGVRIYPQVYVGDGVEIGEGTVLRPGVKVYAGCRIGARCIIHSGAVIGADGFGFAPTARGYEKIAQIGNVVIEDDVEIGANTTVDRATFGSTVIGRGTKLDNLIQVAHNVVVGSDNVFAAQTGIAGSTHIGDRNRVGGQCGFAGHIRIGSDNEFGAQSGIPNSVGDGNRLIGYPAVKAGVFAREVVYRSRLGELFSRIEKLEKQLTK